MNTKLDGPGISRRGFLAFAAASSTLALLAPRQLFAQDEGLVQMARRSAASGNITVQKLRGNISVLMGAGGNIAVLPGPDGKLLIDAGFAGSTGKPEIEPERPWRVPPGSQARFAIRSVYDRRMFASVFGVSRTAHRHRREKGKGMRARDLTVRSLQSGLLSDNRGIWAQFASLAGSKGGNSLQSRLHGGERGIQYGCFYQLHENKAQTPVND